MRKALSSVWCYVFLLLPVALFFVVFVFTNLNCEAQIICDGILTTGMVDSETFDVRKKCLRNHRNEDV